MFVKISLKNCNAVLCIQMLANLNLIQIALLFNTVIIYNLSININDILKIFRKGFPGKFMHTAFLSVTLLTK